MTNYRLGSAESLQRITIPLVRLLFYHASLLSKTDFISLNPDFFANSEKSLSAYFQFAQMDLARATLVLLRVLRTLINSIAKNLHKLKIRLRFYFFYKKPDIQAIKNSDIQSELFYHKKYFFVFFFYIIAQILRM